MSRTEGRLNEEKLDDSLSAEEIPVFRIELRWENPPPGNNHAMELRGALATQFPDNPLFHQHQDDRFVYRYPLIQYRWAGKRGVIVGFHQGAMELVTLPWFGLKLRLGETEVMVIDADFSCKMERFTFANEFQRYRFRSPWLALSQRNYEKYFGLSPEEQAAERNRLLIGNLLSAAKGLGVFLKERVLATFELQRAVLCRYKEQELQGFFGTVVTNLILPEDLAIGSKVSHGFGWLVKERLSDHHNKD
jgi:hypothetical protein